jgi:hypothetical protein
MKRQFVLIPLLAVALVGFAKGQGTGEQETSAKEGGAKKVFEPMSIPVTLVISDDEVKSDKDKAAEKAALEVESQFIHSFNGDRELLASTLAPDFLMIAERFGTGYWQDKAQSLLVRTGPTEKMVNASIDHRITVHVYNGDTVILTGISYTVLTYEGKLSKVTRQFMFVYAKVNGRWLSVSKAIADIPKGLASPAPAMMLLGPDGQPPPAPAGSTSIYHWDYHWVPAETTTPSN